jgi:hypothetical protein
MQGNGQKGPSPRELKGMVATVPADAGTQSFLNQSLEIWQTPASAGMNGDSQGRLCAPAAQRHSTFLIS